MKKWISYCILVLCIPVVVVLGNTAFSGKKYAFFSLVVVLLACVPFFLSFERKRQSSTRLVLIAVMTALSVAGRLLFAPIASFKPVAAMVILTGMYFGGEAGFMTGAMTAVLSNFYFSQGAWTPFQMFSWGFIGLLSGILAEPLKRNRWLLYGFGFLSGALFSLLMDVYTVFSMGNRFNLPLYFTKVASSAPVTIVYCVSNVIFLLLLAKPIGRRLQRIKDKYGI